MVNNTKAKVPTMSGTQVTEDRASRVKMAVWEKMVARP
jgi:hypothetical protein